MFKWKAVFYVSWCGLNLLQMGTLWGKESSSSVRIWEEPLVIPTYQVGPAELSPAFYDGRVYQGAKGPIYPYPLMDRLTDDKRDQTYKVINLENQYIKISVLPELGGRIFSGLDKTNNYDFFYRQHVIKPALIGMLGAWISGGVEWNIPHHHRASTFMPVDYRLVENPDGSKTVWVGELEWRHRMRWIVGLTLYPGKSFIEATVKLFNRTPLPHSMLYFANVAVSANPDYQVLFPPSTEYGTQHSKIEFIEWPIARSRYSGQEHDGVDVSWWKNHANMLSIFAWNDSDDFLGGYDHGKQAGVVHVADHHVVPGKKFFEWSSSSEGQMWDKVLTDTDGPYLELMAGAYSDNQPDYSWVQPYEVKTIKQYWYPVRELGGLKNANLDAAVNLDIDANHLARFAFNTTSEFSAAKAVLTVRGKVFFEQEVSIDPAHPFQKQLALSSGISAEEVKVSLFSASGKELISFQPQKKAGSPMPEPVKPPPEPEKILNNEELYLTGQRLEQFHNPTREPYPYYQEALKRDPADARTNTALGVLFLKRGLYQEAEIHFRKAIERLTINYTQPKDGEAFYYLGLTLQSQGRFEEADVAFHKAGWSAGWYGPGHLALTENACRRGDYKKALEFIDQALSVNVCNTKAMNIKSAVLRNMGRFEEAMTEVARIQMLDPLDFWAINESYLIASQAGKKAQAEQILSSLKKLMRGNVQSYLEMAVDYSHCGWWDDSINVLERYVTLLPDKTKVYPMVYYYLGYFWDQKGGREKALNYYQLAAQMPVDYCFPFRLESKIVLEQALQLNPQDARAPFYLGNLLYDLQPQNAIQAWERAQSLDDRLALVHRNLGFAYFRVGRDLNKAIASMEKAVARDPGEPQYYAELDELYEKAGEPLQKRLALLEKNQTVVEKRGDSLMREISLLIQTRHYDRAIQLLDSHHFRCWEGNERIAHDLYVDAHLQRGESLFHSKNYIEALKDFVSALEYPDRFELGKPSGGADRTIEAEYHIGKTYEALGELAKARIHYQLAIAPKLDGWSELSYFQGLTHQKLSQEIKARELFRGLVEFGRRGLKFKKADEFYSKFGNAEQDTMRQARSHYLIGLGLQGEGKIPEAKNEFQQVLKLDLNHLGARSMLAGDVMSSQR